MRINRIFEGSTEIMHLLIAREAVDQHLQVAGDVLMGDGGLADKAKAAAGAAAFYAKWFPGLTTGEGQKPGSFAEFGPLASHLRYVERTSRKLARTTFYQMGRYQAGLEQRGSVLGRIVDIGAELFAISAACVYAQRLGQEDPSRREGAQELAELFCTQARRRAERKFSELWGNDDAKQYKLAQRVMQGEFAWFDQDVLDPAGDGPMLPPADVPAADRFAAAPDVAAPDVEPTPTQ
jgi:hypothetical protein